MLRFSRHISIIVAVVALLLVTSASFSLAQDAPLRFGAIIKTEANEYWQAMAAGYEFAAARYGVEVVVGSVPTEADTDEQLALAESYLDQGFDALLVSPITPSNLNSALAAATEAGIPVINVDELIPADAAADAGIDIALRIASNNYQAGQLAGNYVLANLEAGSQVAILEGLAGNVSGQARRDGFFDTVNGTMNVVASQPADWDRTRALDVTTNILQANPDVKAIYAANDTMALGATEAVRAAGLEGQIIIIGTDAVPEALDAIRDGRMTGTVAQYPFEIGVLAVENAIKLAAGRPIPTRIDAPIRLLTAGDLDAPVQPMPDPAIGDLSFGAIIKTEANEYWQAMADGYAFAAETYGVNVQVGSVPTEADTDEQLALAESYLDQGFDALLVSPITPSNLNSALAAASEAGLPVINVDELIPAAAAAEAGIDIAQRIASNNYQAGQLAGNYVLANLEAGAQVAILEGLAGNVSGQARRDGFFDTVSGTMNVVASQPADWDRTRALDVTTNILQANPDVKAIYAANDTMALGAAEAVRAAGLEGQIIIIGTDAVPEALDAIREGRMTGTVAQYPYEIGVLAVENAIKLAEGRPIPMSIDAPIRLLTADNVG
ncbi:MAG: substrate-binding domain-containing protein [Chloroflexi bacterium]|nr:substrate-binding domain-containing protein [Chloroflexota bacterium]